MFSNDPNIDKKVEILYDRMYKHYISPAYYEKVFDDWKWRDTSIVKNVKEFIKDRLQLGYKVTTGFMASPIRDCHDYMIFWKERESKYY